MKAIILTIFLLFSSPFLMAASPQQSLNQFASPVKFFNRLDYTLTNVTTGAYVELIASTSDKVQYMELFDSSGQTLKIAIGGAGSEVDKFIIFPGGNNKIIVDIPAGSRVAIRALSATANAGESSINFFGE